jgi:hypothetical protein
MRIYFGAFLVYMCNSLNSTLRTALARFHVPDRADIPCPYLPAPRFARPEGG